MRNIITSAFCAVVMLVAPHAVMAGQQIRVIDCFQYMTTMVCLVDKEDARRAAEAAGELGVRILEMQTDRAVYMNNKSRIFGASPADAGRVSAVLNKGNSVAAEKGGKSVSGAAAKLECDDHFQKNEWCGKSGSCEVGSGTHTLKAAPIKFASCHPTNVACRGPDTISLHPNGYLKSCTLSDQLTTTSDGRTPTSCKSGSRVQFDARGYLLGCN